ncbi:MAG: hypothetical protein QG604_604 [Candidatus Dependentiae bacterium]|nr:hypothetical protein [Candidatus Dependentiae bacterium]
MKQLIFLCLGLSLAASIGLQADAYDDAVTAVNSAINKTSGLTPMVGPISYPMVALWKQYCLGILAAFNTLNNLKTNSSKSYIKSHFTRKAPSGPFQYPDLTSKVVYGIMSNSGPCGSCALTNGWANTYWQNSAINDFLTTYRLMLNTITATY